MADTRAQILVVDDQEFNRVLLRVLLEKEGHRILEADHGRDAIELARTLHPDLILLDVMMPDIDGYQVCQALKADGRTRDIPVIFLSARSESADKIHGLGLGAVDYVAKPFDGGEVLARVRSHLEIRRLTTTLLEANRALTEKQMLLDADLRAAAAIQRSLAAVDTPDIEGLAIAARFLPCDRVGGDIFNFCRLDEEHVAAYVVDVSGHGVPAAMVTVSVSQSLMPQAGHVIGSSGGRVGVEIRPPHEVLARLDQAYPIERFDKFFTIAYLVLNLRSGFLQYSLAGHPFPFLVRADGTVEVLDAGGPIIGLDGDLPFDQAELFLARGDRLFLYTDGIVEFENAGGESFGLERLEQVLRDTQRLPLDDACGRVIAAMNEFGGGRALQDDATLVAIEPTVAMVEPASPSVRRLVWSIDSRLDAIRDVAVAVRDLCASDGLSEDDLYAVELVVMEALSNSVQHAYDGEPGHPIEVEARLDKGRFEVSIIDRGEGFVMPPPVLPDADVETRGELAEGGRGLFLMHSLMDEVRYQRQGDRNVLTLVKLLTGRE